MAENVGKIPMLSKLLLLLQINAQSPCWVNFGAGELRCHTPSMRPFEAPSPGEVQAGLNSAPDAQAQHQAAESSTALPWQAGELQQSQGATGQHSPGVLSGHGVDGDKAGSAAVPMQVGRGVKKGEREVQRLMLHILVPQITHHSYHSDGPSSTCKVVPVHTGLPDRSQHAAG